MAAMTIHQLYDEQIARLAPDEQLRLAVLIIERILARGVEVKPRRSILEQEGLGAEHPVGMDAQEYVNKLREEWDHRR